VGVRPRRGRARQVRTRHTRPGIDDAQPRVRRQEPCGDQRHAGLRVIPLRGAAPRPVLGAWHEAGSERLRFDGLTGPPQVNGRLQHFNLQWPGRGQWTGRAPNPLVARGMGSRYPLQQRHQPRRSRGADDELPVVGHDAVRDQSHRMALEALAQDPEKRAVIRGSQEFRTAGGPVAGHMEEAGADAR